MSANGAGLCDKGSFIGFLSIEEGLVINTKSEKLPRVSIIIPFYKNLAYLQECVRHCLTLDYPDYEIIVVSNSPLELSDERVKVIVTDEAGQAYKKDLGVAHASGEICAFIDDDAYPKKDWVKNAIKHFNDPDVVAVGGPGITPPNDSLMQKAGGLIYSLPIGGGEFSYRYVAKKVENVDEIPGYNLFIRKSFLKEVGGFDIKYRSGEDTIFSYKVTRAGKRLVYVPDVVVYHHRRPLFIPHLKQVANYALHRGYFAKKYPETSAKLPYALPSILLFTIIAWAVASLLIPIFRPPFLAILISYITLSLILALVTSKSFKLAGLACVGVPLTHIVYAIYFIKGLLTKELGERPSY